VPLLAPVGIAQPTLAPLVQLFENTTGPRAYFKAFYCAKQERS
jgi:hypothetical protein